MEAKPDSLENRNTKLTDIAVNELHPKSWTKNFWGAVHILAPWALLYMVFSKGASSSSHTLRSMRYCAVDRVSCSSR